LNQGTIYPALLRLQESGWIKAEWGMSPTKRSAKFYSLTHAGHKHMEQEAKNWECTARIMARFLATSNIGRQDGTETSHS
jgi:DNA-binding PadR family transcriptional regulator